MENGGEQRAVVDSNTVESQMSNTTDEPTPLAILESAEDGHSFNLNKEQLEKLLLNPEIADKKVAIISLAGAFRMGAHMWSGPLGKSFILNFFLRYLKCLVAAKMPDQAGYRLLSPDDWLDTESELRGFRWRGGIDRETDGILLWSQPFILRKDGEEVVVLLMDTQGAFDNTATVKSCAIIFAISTLLSSVQVYNIGQQILERDLQHLQLFTEYGRLVLEEEQAGPPFQTLTFLIRDWPFPYEDDYGFGGGEQALEKVLQIRDGQPPELRSVRNYIRSSFSDVSCFLMPHPGLTVATSPTFSGGIDEIDAEFLRQMHAFVTVLFDPKNIVVKQINGQAVTCRELAVYFETYNNFFRGEELPEPKSMFAAMAEANNLAAIASAKAIYVGRMEMACGGDTPYTPSADLLVEHRRSRREAIRHFREAKKMGGVDFSFRYEQKLKDEIKVSFRSFQRGNDAKNLFKSMRTPAVLFVIMLLNYVFQAVFILLRIDAASDVFVIIFLLTAFTISLWAYLRYSGKWKAVVSAIDNAVEVVWRYSLLL